MWSDSQPWWLETKLGVNVVQLNTAYQIEGAFETNVIAISALQYL